ncbi:MAG TPA: hypothetical protein VGZ89_06750 [Xanthobacteraceae bacterium]|jgi:hypothetical protein|nr:hypothetical protein [Xanthobacteraceae bacterium]
MCQKETHAPQQKDRYSITSSAVESGDGGIVTPSAFGGLKIDDEFKLDA